MNFSVTYRNRDGVMVAEDVAASDRADLIRQLKERGVSPTSIREGGGGAAHGPSVRAGGAADAGGRRRGRRGVRAVLLLAAGAAVVAGVGVWVMRGRPAEGPVVREPVAVPVPKKVVVPVERPQKAVPVAEPKTNLPPRKASYAPVRKGDEPITFLTNRPNGKVDSRLVPRRIVWSRAPKSVFRTPSDRQIERLLRVKPGQILIGTLDYDRFEEQFKKSLRTEIKIEADDTPEVRAVKEAVLATRAEMQERLKQGEDLGEIMRATERELQQSAAYRLNLEHELQKLRREEGMTKEKMETFAQAANAMLKSRGIAELALPGFWYNKLKLDSELKGQGAKK